MAVSAQDGPQRASRYGSLPVSVNGADFSEPRTLWQRGGKPMVAFVGLVMMVVVGGLAAGGAWGGRGDTRAATNTPHTHAQVRSDGAVEFVDYGEVLNDAHMHTHTDAYVDGGDRVWVEGSEAETAHTHTHTPAESFEDVSGDASSGNKTGASNTTQPAKEKHCRDCTLDECKALKCDPSVVPYACVSGFAKGGCSKVESAWLNPGCDDCCSLKGCAAMAPTCGECEPADCVRMKVVCGLKRPYACVEGPSMGGCSDNKDQWPSSYFNGICRRCCDLSTCPAPPGCSNCTQTQCVQVGNSCSSDKHYACTDGPNMGGCASTEEYWTKAEFTGMCFRCCDAVSCGKS